MLVVCFFVSELFELIEHWQVAKRIFCVRALPAEVPSGDGDAEAGAAGQLWVNVFEKFFDDGIYLTDGLF